MDTHDDAITDLPRFLGKRGELTFMQSGDHIPFEIEQVSWFDGFGERASPGHPQAIAHEAVVVALAGVFQVEWSDSGDTPRIRLDRPYRKLSLPPGRPWAIRDRSADAIALVASSRPLDCGAPGMPETPVQPVSAIDARTSSVEDCVMLNIPTVAGPEGRCTWFRLMPGGDLRVRRIYYLTGLQEGSARGSHAHRALHQFVVAVRGSFKVRIQDGRAKRTILLDRADRALHLVPGIWRDLHSFSGDAICLVMASRLYEEDDYLRRYRDFRALKGR